MIVVLPSCARRTSKSKCRPAIPSQALLELRHNFELRGDEVRDEHCIRQCGILFPCRQGKNGGEYWRMPARGSFTTSELLQWESNVHYTVRTYARLMVILTTRAGPWHSIIESNMLRAMSFQYSRNRWHVEGTAVRDASIQHSDLGIKIQEMFNLLGDPNCPKWKTLLRRLRSKTLSTEELMVTGLWKNELDKCGLGEPLTWKFYYCWG